MTLFETIKAASLTARKAREAEKASLLSTLIGEIETLAKAGKSTSDADVTAILKKFVKNVDEVLKVAPAGSIAADAAKREKQILESFLPQQLTEAELQVIISTYIAEGAKNVGDVMKRLKAEHDGTYDGKLASIIIKGKF